MEQISQVKYGGVRVRFLAQWTDDEGKTWWAEITPSAGRHDVGWVLVRYKRPSGWESSYGRLQLWDVLKRYAFPFHDKHELQDACYRTWKGEFDLGRSES